MGEGLAVEIAQQSHYTLLHLRASCMRSDEIVALRRRIPQDPFFEFLTIDDHLGLQKV